jgi:hypothetical protein
VNGIYTTGQRARAGDTWDGKESKEYLCMKHCVEGMMMGWRKVKGPLEAFNLGQPRQTLVDEVADIVIEEMKLGWKPTTSPDDAIKVTTRWTLANS